MPESFVRVPQSFIRIALTALAVTGLASSAFAQAGTAQTPPATPPTVSSTDPGQAAPTTGSPARPGQATTATASTANPGPAATATGATPDSGQSTSPPAGTSGSGQATQTSGSTSDSSLIVPTPSTAAASQATPTTPAPKPAPFSQYDFTWLSGNARTKESPVDNKFFTGEFRADTEYTESFNHPADDTIGGSTEVFRSGEFQVTQLGVGGDFHYDNVQMRLMTQFGMYSTTTPRNDASPARGQWDLADAYRYISEAYGGYHWDKLDGINVQAGIFMSYIGLWSYYQFDNWTYQPSYVSSNTPWFFNGMRIQIFTSPKLKIEPWLVNGWQSYGRFNTAPGVGAQILWRPNGSFSLVLNNYYGADTLGTPDRKRFHTDDSIQVKYYDKPDNPISKAAFTFTVDAGCEHGGGVVCHGGTTATPSQYFLGFMAYNRAWFAHDRYAFTVGGGAITNPGRYLVLLPPINGATAATGTPYFTENPGDPFKAWDMQTTFDYLPSQYVTFRGEFVHRHASVPYFSGQGGITPPGGNTDTPGSAVAGWAPDLRNAESRVTFAILVKF